MRIKLDENMPTAAAEFLTAQGCDVETVLSENLGGASDPVIVEAAKNEARVLITFDKGIANASNPQYAGHAGLILLRLKHPSTAAILTLLQKHFASISKQDLSGRILVMSNSGIRIR